MENAAGLTRLWQFKAVGSTLVWSIPSPDRRYLAISLQGANTNVWMLEGF
jgi:hypothetical protein